MMQRGLRAAKLAAPGFVRCRFSAGQPRPQSKSNLPLWAALGASVGVWIGKGARAEALPPFLDEAFAKIAKFRRLRALAEPFDLGGTHVRHPIKRTVDADIKTRLARSDQRTTIVAGHLGVGKTFAIASALTGEQGVVNVVIDGPEWKLTLYRSVGVTNHTQFVKALKQAKDILGDPPLLYLEVPRRSTVDVKELSAYCKQLVTDERLARVVVVASQLSTAVGFDAGGANRQYNMWIPPMTDGEALEYLSKHIPGLPQADADRIVKEVGTNISRLDDIAMYIEDGMTVDAALEKKYSRCARDVGLVRGAAFRDYRGKQHCVGRQITDELLKSKKVSNERWTKLGFPVEVIATEIDFVVYYNTVDKMWHFQSPMHERIVREGCVYAGPA